LPCDVDVILVKSNLKFCEEEFQCIFHLENE